ncbi:TauD/TfdA family dioxygenase [Albirhodobacter sp. R86504]|uniref:TauD/TfdA family dioxygenase n=1 Tax=Albirhodobacter sp. R86504 TaxID=3093848 RepID=UPI0036700C7F
MTDITFEFKDKGMVIGLPEGPTYFNYYWLRDTCVTTLDPQTRERIFDISSVTSQPVALSAHVDGDMLVIAWENEVQPSRVPMKLIREMAANGRPHDPAELPRNLWFSDHLPRITRVPQNAVLETEDGLATLTRALIVDGIAVVTGMDKTDEALFRLVQAIGPVTPSAEGLDFNVRVEINPTNLAFTAGPLEMHTDLPGEEKAPGVQFLHCLENTVQGGLSLFLDGAAVAEALRVEDPKAFALLASEDIPFFYRHDNWDYRAHQRVIETDHDGNVTGVTISQHLQDTIDLPQEMLDDYYPALIKFIQLMQEDRFMIRFRSEAGNCVIFDNHRIVHGREGYVADSGARHLRGCYSDRGALRSTYRVLAGKGFDGMVQPAETKISA